MSDTPLLKEEAGILTGFVLSSILDGLALAIWLILQRLVKFVEELAPLDGIDEIEYITFRILFGITTLIPILYHIVRNVVIYHYRTARTINEEKNRK
ncbi:MAG: hypothetical protein GY803_31765 [Chloroflexi bacterium]|nr:hypothetical protein [Chloroflexota bacterium]